MKKINTLSALFLTAMLFANVAQADITYTLQNNQWSLIAIPAGLGNENTPALVFGDEIENAQPGATYENDWVMWKYGPFGIDGAQDYQMVEVNEVLDNRIGYWLIQAVAESLDVTLPADAIVAGDLPNGNNNGDTLVWTSANPGAWIATPPPSRTSQTSSLPPSLGINYIIALQGTFPSRSFNDPFVGEVAMFAGNFAPRGWALCNGQLLPILENQALFSLLGTQYGGDGRTTFALPDLRGRAPVHAGSGPGLSNVSIGQRFGNETHEHLLP